MTGGGADAGRAVVAADHFESGEAWEYCQRSAEEGTAVVYLGRGGGEDVEARGRQSIPGKRYRLDEQIIEQILLTNKRLRLFVRAVFATVRVPPESQACKHGQKHGTEGTDAAATTTTAATAATSRSAR